MLKKSPGINRTSGPSRSFMVWVTQFTASAKTVIRRHPRRVAFLIAAVALILTAGLFYHLGQTNYAGKLSQNVAVTAPTKHKTTPSFTPPPAVGGVPSGAYGVNSNSGFFRLSGTVQNVSKDLLAIKLDSGTVVTLSVTATTKYFTSGHKAQPVNTLKKSTSVLVIGVVDPTGVFTASNIQAQK